MPNRHHTQTSYGAARRGGGERETDTESVGSERSEAQAPSSKFVKRREREKGRKVWLRTRREW